MRIVSGREAAAMIERLAARGTEIRRIGAASATHRG